MIQIGLILYCILLYIRPADWVPGIRDWPLEFMVLGLTALGAGIRAYSLRGTDEAPLTRTHLRFIILWIIAILLSNVSKLNFDAAGEHTVIFIKKCFISITLWLALNSLGKMRWMAFTMVICAGALGYQGIYQKAHGFGWAGQPLYWDDRICWVGLWDGANVLSVLFVTSVPFALEVIFGSWRLPYKILAVGALGLTLTGLVLAASRGGWLALAVIIFVYFKRRVGWLGLGVAAIALAGLMVIAPSRLSRDDERDSSSTQGRISMWGEGIEMFRSNPVFGIGKGQFGKYTSILIAHNTFVQNMGETGSFGLFAWVGLIYMSFKSLRVVRQAADQIEDKRLLSMNAAVFTSLTGYLAASMFVSTDFDLLYLLLGLAGAMLTITKRETGLPLSVGFERVDARNVALLIMAGVITIQVVTITMSG